MIFTKIPPNQPTRGSSKASEEQELGEEWGKKELQVPGAAVHSRSAAAPQKVPLLLLLAGM